jgi:hypothetical protein
LSKNIQSDEPVKGVVQKPVAGEAGHAFSLSVPYDAIAVTQGTEQKVLIGINRGLNFREEVTIKLTGLPEGVCLESNDLIIRPSSTDITVVLKATSNAALGDFTAQPMGHTRSCGADFSADLKLTVNPAVEIRD